MSTSRSIILYALFSLLIFLVIPAVEVILAADIQPERGSATTGVVQTQVQGGTGTISYTIDFWNVGSNFGANAGSAYGEDGGGYSNATLVMDSSADMLDKTAQGVFTGGPNGRAEFSLGGTSAVFRLVNGTYFEYTSGNKTYQLMVDDTSIFDAWNEPASEEKLEDSGARFSDLSGQIEVCFPKADGTYDFEEWYFAELEMELPVGTRIKTSDKSGAVISFADMTTFIMKPQTEIILSSPAAKESQVKLLGGNLWINIEKMFKDGSMEIEMSQAVAGIKGTTLVLEETSDKSTLKVIEGTVSFKSKSSGKTEMVNAGETSVADKSGLEQKTTFDADAEIASWENVTEGAGADVVAAAPAAASESSSMAMIVLVAAAGVIALAAFGLGGYALANQRGKKKAASAQTLAAHAVNKPANSQVSADSPIASNIELSPPTPKQEEATTAEAPPKSPKYCTNCGGAISPGTNFCGQCGAGVS